MIFTAGIGMFLPMTILMILLTIQRPGLFKIPFLLAAMLFGLLYQGGTELSFAKTHINRDVVVVIQGLIILFMGALEQAFRPYLAALFFKAED